jgi:archaellum component FlaF (FlaF/FlaG flagellin family)
VSRLAILVAVSAAPFVLTATAASSQVTGIVTSRSVSVEDLYDSLSTAGAVPDSAAQYSFPNGSSPYFQAIENYQVSADVTPSEITFANNATSQGYVSMTSSSTVVSVTFTNNGSTTVDGSIDSTILPGGFGFFMDSPQDNPTLSGNAIGDVNQTPPSSLATFQNISGFDAIGIGQSEGYAGFSFDILENGTQVAGYSGSVSLNLSLASPGVNVSVAASAPPALNGFALITPAGSDQAVGYQWNTTEVVVPLGALAPGQSTTVTYETTVSTSTDVQNFNNCPTEDVCPQLLAYSGFGDPIRKSAGTGTDPYFPTFDLSLPTFDPRTGVAGGMTIDGVGPSLPLAGVTPAPFIPIPFSILGPVPEPEVWTLMLAGMGGIGLALRGRRPSARTGRRERAG